MMMWRLVVGNMRDGHERTKRTMELLARRMLSSLVYLFVLFALLWFLLFGYCVLDR